MATNSNMVMLDETTVNILIEKLIKFRQEAQRGIDGTLMEFEAPWALFFLDMAEMLELNKAQMAKVLGPKLKKELQDYLNPEHGGPTPVQIPLPSTPLFRLGD